MTIRLYTEIIDTTWLDVKSTIQSMPDSGSYPSAMGLADSNRSILVVIDLQGKLVDKVHRSPLVLAATHRLLELAQLFAVPVVLTEQYPRGLGPTQPELLAHYEELTVPRQRVEKGAFGCFGDAGFEAALAAVRAIVPGRGVHAVGYCIGGTLLSLAAARLAGRGDTSLRSMTLLAAQTDFSEPGELSVFITPAQLAMLEAIMQEQGVLTSDRMGAAFALLRSSDLIWAPAIKKYVRGQKESMIDLMAWNADGTRMPARMHSEYLARLYLRNELAQGGFTVDGERVDLAALRLPMFVLGTETDHVAPWRSVYKARGLTRSDDYTFGLTSGGHNAGIVSGPQNPKRRHRTLRWRGTNCTLSPEQYMESAELHAGSWWPTWHRWLAEHSAAEQVQPPGLGNAGAGYAAGLDAPGEYVRG